ncbi:MAG: ankyrin repeat domain-containing protein [Ottowia sp.]|nr:ankyrin repeat domain-containing protein [Ottowia sp.]
MLERLLAAGADCTAADSEGKTALMAAAERGYAPIIRRLLEAEEEKSPLPAGLQSGAEMVRHKTGALLQAADKGGRISSRLAPLAGFLGKKLGRLGSAAEKIRLLDKAGALAGDARKKLRSLMSAQVHMADNKGRTALMFAAQGGHVEAARQLIEAGADVNAASTYLGMNVLMLAAGRGHNEVLVLLLEAGADVAATGKNGSTALIEAASKNNLDSMHCLLDAGARVDAARADGWTALMLAAWRGQENALAFLLERSASPNIADRSGMTALMLATVRGRAAIVRRLLDAGANINAFNHDGESALISAATKGNADMLALLLERGARIDAANRDGATALMLAAGLGHSDATRLLLEKGAAVNATNRDGATALMYAVWGGGGLEQLAVIRALLGSGADVDAANRDGWTALMFAARDGYKSVVDRLLEAGANASIVREDGATALGLALARGREEIATTLRGCTGASADDAEQQARASRLKTTVRDDERKFRNCAKAGNLEEVRKWLEAGGIDVNAADGDSGETALMFAAHGGHEAVVGFLLQRGADARLAAQDGNTALLLAAKGNADGAAIARVTASLLAHGADVNATNQSGWTALMYAAQTGDEAPLDTLLDAGAAVNAVSGKRDTALLALLAGIASASVKTRLATRLIEHGADINAQDQHGATALMYAALHGLVDISRLLIEKGADYKITNSSGATARQIAKDMGTNAAEILAIIPE